MSRAGARRRVAVIGSGVAGITAAYILQQDCEVTLIEADGRLGGHADTHEVVTDDAGLLAVDTGFIVHNRVTYPNLLRLFGELDVVTQPTEMSMSVRCDGCGLEYCGARGPGGVFARRSSLASPRFWRMLTEINRFHRQARATLRRAEETVTLGAFLDAAGYSAYFVNHFVVPVVSAVWSAAPETALLYPASYLFTFLANHGMLSVKGSHQWYTVAGGSQNYVRAATKNLAAVRLSMPVRSLRRLEGAGVEVVAADGAERFDAAVVATHPGTALGLLDRPSDAERRVLGAFDYSANLAVLHRDESLLPMRPSARAAWNYLIPDCDAPAGKVVVSYDMNRLQKLPTRQPHIVTLNADDRIDPDLVIDRMEYEHPIYTPSSVAAQRGLAGLNDATVAFAGAYHGWGFHEDGCRAGVAAAASLGVGW